MKARLPLADRTVAGVQCPYPAVKLRVRDRYGSLVPLLFRVDTQADFTTLPIPLAQREGIPFASTDTGIARGLTGHVTRYRDRLRLVIAGREHDWPCDFVATPSPPPGTPLAELSPVLGRAGFLDEYAISIDSGFLIITRLGPLRLWWRPCRHGLWQGLGLVHPLDEPL
jgi:hypothetical protein